MEAWVEVKTNMAVLVALQLLTNTSRRALDMHAVYQRRIYPVKRMLDTEDNLETDNPSKTNYPSVSTSLRRAKRRISLGRILLHNSSSHRIYTRDGLSV